MAVAAAATLPALLQAGGPTSLRDENDCCSPSRRYRKYELIGQGAQKKVYRAFDEERAMEVAWNEVAISELACFREKDQQRVVSEILVLKQLKHKNIMTLYDYWFDEQRLLLVFITEIFPDGTLRQYRRRHKHADLSAIKRWAWQILQGLVYLHGHNPPIIHRDLKCDNIFVCGSSGVVKIGDLGLVTLCRDFSAPQSVLGTPEFMAPELYEEKYDEKVDVYAFGMCVLELATMEYPYNECKNAAQIYRKVTKGIPPASVEKLASSELRDFVMLCLCHDPSRRPEARQLLKHPFFEAIRAAPSHMGSCGTPPKLTVVSSVSCISSAPASRPTTLTSSGSATSAILAAAAAEAMGGISPTALSRSSSSTSQVPVIATPSGGIDVATAQTIASIAAAAGGRGGAVTATASPLMSVNSSSLELPQSYLHSQVQLPFGPIAASISPQPPSPIAAAVNTQWYATGHRDLGSAIPPLAAPLPVPAAPGIGSGGGVIIAAAVNSPSMLSNGRMGLSPLSFGGLGSIASSLSPTAHPGLESSAWASDVGEGTVPSPGVARTLSSPMTLNSDSTALAYQNNVIACTASAGILRNHSSLASGALKALNLAPRASCANPSVAGTVPAEPHPMPGEFHTMAAGIPAEHPKVESLQYSWPIGAGAARMAEGRSQQATQPPSGVSASAAAIAVAAVNAAAAAVAASGGATMSAPLGLPAIQEEHELQEDMMFEYGAGRRAAYCGNGNDDSDDDKNDEEDDGCGSSGDLPGRPLGTPLAIVGGGRSQPVNLQVRSSGQAAMTNMALSFAMSFTNQRGVRKKVGFQYDLLHDTASAIAVEMVENLSLNTAEAEAIAAMIQHEVSRFNVQQQQLQEEQVPHERQ